MLRVDRRILIEIIIVMWYIHLMDLIREVIMLLRTTQVLTKEDKWSLRKLAILR